MSAVQTSVARENTLTIRPLRDDEKANFVALAKRSLPHVMEQLTFGTSPDSFVVERAGEWVGGLVLKTHTFGGKRWGEISWVFTAPEARGIGAAQALIDHALAFFDEHKFDGVYTYVEGDNPSSFKLFTTRGFARAPFGDQWARFGFNLLPMWFTSNFVFATAHFFYIRPMQPQPYRGALHMASAILFATVCLTFGFWLWNVPFGVGVLFALLASIVFIGGRAAAMLLAARAVGLPSRFLMTEPMTFIALFVGFSSGLVPIPGGVYPSADDWRQRDVRDKLGIIGFAGAAFVLVALWLLLLLNRAAALPMGFAQVAQPFILLAIFDVLLPFIKGYAASRVWNWSKPAWAVLLIALVGLFVALAARG
jgi:ribosomal protein S18 acetylase RimI-like enzyme